METKIGIVEDEIIIADSIRSVLKSMQYSVPEPCCDYHESIIMLQNERPDLVLLDINLSNNELDGIAVAKYIRSNMDIPFIFLTANCDTATLERAKTVTPNAFLVKPFQKEDLYTAIEIALHNFYSAKVSSGKRDNNFIFIKEGNSFKRINFDDILYLESDHVYVTVHTTNKKYLIRSSLQHYLEQLNSKIFMRVHRGFVINLCKIDSIDSNSVVIGNTSIPVSKKHKETLLKQFSE